MKSKAHFINELCKLKNINPECDEAKSFESLKIVELLVEMNKFKPPPKKKKEEDTDDDDDDDDDEGGASNYAGCRF